MSSNETLKEKVVDEYGNIRSDEQGYMNGADVFNFVIREVPKDFYRLLEFSGHEISHIDYFVFHQANSYINGFLAKKLKLQENKIPSTIAKYGNTSSVSVPLTIVSELKDELQKMGFIIFEESATDTFLLSANPAWILNLAQFQLEEEVEPFTDYHYFDTTFYSKDFFR